MGLCVLCSANATLAQTDAGAKDESAHSDQKTLPRNKTTAERISAPNPTTEGVPWTLPIFWAQSTTVNSLSRGKQLTPSTSYAWWFTLAPRWLFNDALSIGASETFSFEWTSAAQEEFNRAGFYSRELLWEDLRLDTTYIIPKRPAGIMFVTAFDLRLPTSEFSRSRQRYLSPGARFTAQKSFDVLQGLQLGLTGAFWGWFAGSNVVLGPDDVFPCRVAPAPGGGGGSIGTDPCYGAIAATQHSTRLTLFTTFVPINRLALGLGYTTVWGKAYDLAVGCVDTLTGEVCLDDESANEHWRTFSNFQATVGYDFTPYFSGGLSYDTWAAHPDSDGGRENVFYNENTRLIFTLTVRVDGMYASVRDKRAQTRGNGLAEQTFAARGSQP